MARRDFFAVNFQKMAAKEDHCDDEKIEGCPYEIEKDVELFRGRWMGAREVHFLDRKSGVRKVWRFFS